MIMRHAAGRWLALAALCILTAPAPRAQQIDRSRIPPPGETPELRVPSWTRTTLENGATLIVSERHELPLISFSITFLGGANQFERAERRGLAALTGSMLSEGTASRTGDELSDDLQLLGASVNVNIGDEQGSIGFTATRRTFEPTLAILADMMLHPSLPPEALERLRARTLVSLAQSRSQPNFIGSRAFARILYGPRHPYGQYPTEESIRAVSREEVLALHRAYFQPGRAIVTVVGDIAPAQVKGAVERALAAWPAGGERPSFDYPSPPQPRPTTIYLVDKPDAAQSVVNIGLPGPARNTPDYFALQVMNYILGGNFQSWLNQNIREQHGYSYGVRSSFAYGRGPGAFNAGGAVVSADSDAALVEFMRELRGMVAERPIGDEEFDKAKAALTQSLPGRFASVNGINGAITDLLVENLPDDYYRNFARNISSVAKDDLRRVARRYIDLQHLSIVIVGDRAKIEAPLRAAAIAPVVLFDPETGAVTPAGDPTR